MNLSDTDRKLVTMANQIARNLAAQGDIAAIAATAEHLRLFWEPQMLARLRQLAATPGHGLSPLAEKAVLS